MTRYAAEGWDVYDKVKSTGKVYQCGSQYTADPMVDKSATKYDTISYLQVLERQLRVMDTTAISLCMDNRLPIVVFNLRSAGSIRRVVMGEPVGTTVGV